MRQRARSCRPLATRETALRRHAPVMVSPHGKTKAPDTVPLRTAGNQVALISMLSGNGRILLTLDGGGRWNNLFYPHPGQFQHLREMRFGVFDVGRKKFWWLGEDGGFEVRQSYLGDSNTAITVWSGHGLRVSTHDDV